MTDILLDFQRQIQSILTRLERAEARENPVRAGTWTPTFTGFSADPASPICRYVLAGKMCAAFVRMPAAGTSNATTFAVSSPFTATTVTNMQWYSSCLYTDSGTGSASLGMVTIVSGGTTFNLYKDFVATVWTASGDKRAQFTIIYEVA